MRTFIIGLITLGAILTSKHADAQLIHIGDTNSQPAFTPMGGFNSMPWGYSGYSGYSSMQSFDYSMNQRMLDNMMLSNMMLMTSDTAPRSARSARSAELLTLLPIVLELFPDLQIPGLDVNNSSRLDKIEDKIDKLLAHHDINTTATDDNTGGNSGLAGLIREILGLLRPNNSVQASGSGRTPRSVSAAAGIPEAKRQQLIKQLESMLSDMNGSDTDDPQTAGDRLEAAVDKAEAAVREANAELIRAEAAHQIEEIRRKRDAELRKIAGDKKALSLSDRIKAQKKRLGAVNQKNSASSPETGDTAVDDLAPPNDVDTTDGSETKEPIKRKIR